MTDRSKTPDGFRRESVTTAAGGFEYEVEILQAESLDAILAFYEAEGKNGAEVVRDLWNASNAQGAKQGPKDSVRKALDTGDDAQVAEAVEAAQASARAFVQGAPRGGGGRRHESGLTKKQREAFGAAVAMATIQNGGKAPSQKRMDEICEELGIDPAALSGS